MYHCIIDDILEHSKPGSFLLHQNSVFENSHVLLHLFQHQLVQRIMNHIHLSALYYHHVLCCFYHFLIPVCNIIHSISAVLCVSGGFQLFQKTYPSLCFMPQAVEMTDRLYSPTTPVMERTIIDAPVGEIFPFLFIGKRLSSNISHCVILYGDSYEYGGVILVFSLCEGNQ